MGSSTRKKTSRAPTRLAKSGSPGATLGFGSQYEVSAESLLVPLVEVDEGVLAQISVGARVQVVARGSRLDAHTSAGRLGTIAPEYAAAVREAKLFSGSVAKAEGPSGVVVRLGA